MNEKQKAKATTLAILAAILYALNVPLSKLLLKDVPPAFLAAFLYLGAGFGFSVLYLFIGKSDKKYTKLTKNDLPYTILMIVLDVIAPICLMTGLKYTTAETASLLGNFELAFTAIIAFIIFRERISGALWIGILCIFAGTLALSIKYFGSLKFSTGAILVLTAAVAWGFENNCTRKISSKSTYEIVMLKGIFSGLLGLCAAFISGEKPPKIVFILISLVIGFISYGLSIFCYVRAQNVIGAAKTGAFYGIAPFISVLLGYLIFEDRLGMVFFIGLAMMAIGTVFALEKMNLFIPVYILSVLMITVFRPWHGGFDFFGGGISFNLITEYITLYGTSKYIFWYLLFGNIGVFVPLGYFLMYYKKQTLPKTIAAGLAFSLIIEILQYIFGAGLSELNDLLMNTLGCIIGALFAMLAMKIKHNRKYSGS